MKDHTGFQAPGVLRQTMSINFEQASIALLARYQVHRPRLGALRIQSEWRDPLLWRQHPSLQTGVSCHG